MCLPQVFIAGIWCISSPDSYGQRLLHTVPTNFKQIKAQSPRRYRENLTSNDNMGGVREEPPEPDPFKSKVPLPND